MIAVKLGLSDIETTERLQPRASMNLIAIAEYAEVMKNGRQFPPLEVVFDGDSYWLWDGFHRKAAAEQAELIEVDVNITEGTLQDAEWMALGANQTHGLKRSNEDKRRAVELALGHPASSKLSSNAIAQHCGVSNHLVDKIRCSLGVIPSDRVYTTKHGTQAVMNTTNIGRTKQSPTADIDPDLFQTIIEETDIAESKTEVDALATLPPEKQRKIVRKIVEGEAATVIAAVTQNGHQRSHKFDNRADRGEDGDRCQTPPYAIDPLIPYIPKSWSIYEPCRDLGYMEAAWQDAGYEVITTCYSFDGQDFIADNTILPSEFDAVITNPPYSKAKKYPFIRRCFELGHPFALLIPTETIGTNSLGELYEEFNGFQVMFLRQRPDFAMPNLMWEGKGNDQNICWLTKGLGLPPISYATLKKYPPPYRSTRHEGNKERENAKS